MKIKTPKEIPSHLSDGIKNDKNPIDVANGFNDFFVNVGPSTGKKYYNNRNTYFKR